MTRQFALAFGMHDITASVPEERFAGVIEGREET